MGKIPVQQLAKMMGISEQDLTFKYEAASKRYEMKKKEATDVRGNIDCLQDMLRARSKKYRAWRKKIGETTSYVFNDTLSKSGYAGSAKFDHTMQNMTMKVRATSRAPNASRLQMSVCK